MATYTTNDTFLTINEWHIYGSSRIGVLQGRGDTIWGKIGTDTLKYNKFAKDSSYNLHKGTRRYVGTNHLGNVLTVFTDKRMIIMNQLKAVVKNKKQFEFIKCKGWAPALASLSRGHVRQGLVRINKLSL